MRFPWPTRWLTYKDPNDNWRSSGWLGNYISIYVSFYLSIHFQSSTAFLCISLHFSEFLCISLHFSTFLFISLHFSAFLYMSLHFSTFLCISLHFFAFLCISLHFSAFLCILHFVFWDNLRSVVLWMPFFAQVWVAVLKNEKSINIIIIMFSAIRDLVPNHCWNLPKGHCHNFFWIERTPQNIRKNIVTLRGNWVISPFLPFFKL